ncbi:MAG: hypothetical protein BWY71_01830 [Planctomycetes bacterium ADurb.Bin412]|nr:MAG: hypothetical protein BWY71_01830 [Planctomycetes bacterium ADurb.Bin412]
MQIWQSLLAQMDPEVIKKIEEVHQSVSELDDSIKWILLLAIVTTLLVLTIFIRQRTVAKNQVNIAEMIKQMNRK